MIIDSHVHYSEPDLPHRPYDRELVTRHPELSPPPLSIEHVLRDAARAGIDRVVQITQTRMGYDNRYAVCTENLIRVADVMESPKLAE